MILIPSDEKKYTFCYYKDNSAHLHNCISFKYPTTRATALSGHTLSHDKVWPAYI